MTDPADLFALLPLLAGPMLILSILVYAAIDTSAMQKAAAESKDDDPETGTARTALD